MFNEHMIWLRMIKVDYRRRAHTHSRRLLHQITNNNSESISGHNIIEVVRYAYFSSIPKQYSF